MALISSFTINDGATSPAAHAFTIANRDGMKSEFRNSSASLVRGQETFTHEIRLAKNGAAANRALIGMTYPKEGTVNSLPAVLNSSSAKVELNFAPDASEVDRKAFVGLVINALSQADIKDSIVKLQTLS